MYIQFIREAQGNTTPIMIQTLRPHTGTHSMINARTAAATLAATIISPAIAGTVTTIDFGADLRDPDDGYIILTDQLQHLGVTFDTPDTDGVYWIGNDYSYADGRFSIFSGDPLASFNVFDIRIDFVDLTEGVEIRAFDGGGDIETVRLSAYGVSDNLLAQDVLTSSFQEPGSFLSVMAEDIAYVVLNTTGTGRGVFFDDLSFGQIPTPGTLFILSTAALSQRRRR